MIGTDGKYKLFIDYAKEGGYNLFPEVVSKFTKTMVAIDPGGVHVGVALFGKDNLGWSCAWAREFTPEGFEDWLSEWMLHGLLDIVIVEEFRLFPDKAAEQTGSDMPTSQLIGSIKYIHRALRNKRWPGPEVELIFQTPQIKVPTRSVLRSRGVASMAKRMKTGGHAADAELHGYYHAIHTLEEPIQSLK